jgi:hypothetical protein
MKALPKNMSIVLFLGQNLKEYVEGNEKIIQDQIIQERIRSGAILCESCLQPMARHSCYERKIKETGQKISITVVWCSKCKIWHALLPDFLLPNKHYSGNEIESVVIDSASASVSQIETEASEATVRRWIRQIGERIKRALGRLRFLFRRAGQPVSEAAVDTGPTYSELEQLLEMAPQAVKYSGNKLGLANLWLGTYAIVEYL